MILISPGVSVVVPVYGSTQVLNELVVRTHDALRSLGPFEIILVDDGSQEDTWTTVSTLCRHWPQVSALRLSRNYGQHNALIAGIREARFPVTVTLDDDLQNPPEEIPKLVHTLNESGLDLVYGVPDQIRQRAWRRVASKLARVAFARVLGVEAAGNLSSFRAFRTQLRDSFAVGIGPSASLDALLTWGTTRIGGIIVKHEPRMDSRSNYDVRKLIRFAIDAATGYSTLPLRWASLLGFATAGFGAAILMTVVVRTVSSGQSVPGFPFLASIITIFAGVQLLALGVFGEYLARMHFRVMGRPTYVVRDSIRRGS